MNLPDPRRLIDALTAAAARVVIVTTGGGSRAISHLVTTPGASGVVVEGLVPYAREAVERLLGGPQEAYCASRTARRLAVAAWQRATACGSAAEAAVGLALTASLRSVREKRGAHRVIVAVHTLAATDTAEVVLVKGARSRNEEEDVAAALAIDELMRACVPAAAGGVQALLGKERVVRDRCAAPAPWRDLFAGAATAVPVGVAVPAPGLGPGAVVFPGSFDPLHEGHLRMAGIAGEIVGGPVAFELSITNVDKPTLDYVEIRDRVAQFAGRPLWLTRAATFLEKLDLFPQATFVLGADTFARLADPRYYGGSPAAAAAAADRIAREVRRLVVFGRERAGAWQDPAALDVPGPLRDVSTFVSQRDFRLDVSSTRLRREAREREGAACGD